jgi:hypothetical protein
MALQTKLNPAVVLPEVKIFLCPPEHSMEAD